MDSFSDPYAPRFRRTRTGCLGCRRSKHKCVDFFMPKPDPAPRCDEEKPSCRRCARQSRACVYPGSSLPPQVGSSTRAISTRRSFSRGASAVSPDGGILQPLAAVFNAVPSELPPVDTLALIYPDAEERSLMSHFLCFGTVNMCAIQQRDRPIKFFDIGRSIFNPRGSSVEADSLLLSLVSIAAAHRSAMTTQQDKGYLTSSPVGAWGTPSPHSPGPASHSPARLRAVSGHMSKTSIELGQTAILFKLSNDNASTDTAATVLTGVIGAIISQVMLVGSLWKKAFGIGLEVVKLQGGPAAMLEAARANSPSSLTSVRSLLESLAWVDVVHCLGSYSAPSVLTDAFQPWWFDYAQDESDGRDTFEYGFGMARGIFELANRVNLLVHERRVLSSLPNAKYLSDSDQRVQEILLELTVWESGVVPDGSTLSRVQLGNMIMVHTLLVVVHVELLHCPHSHASVQASAAAALNYLEASRQSFVVGMLVPTLITGSMMLDSQGQEQARGVVAFMRSTVSYGYDTEEALRILDKIYALRRDGAVDPPWRDHIGDVLLL